jgi:hypothetical protein
MTFLCKRNIVAKSREVKTGWSNSCQEQINLAESSEECRGLERAVVANGRASVAEYQHCFPNCRVSIETCGNLKPLMHGLNVHIYIYVIRIIYGSCHSVRRNVGVKQTQNCSEPKGFLVYIE